MEYRSLLNQSALDVDIDDITISGDHDGGFLHVHPSTGLIDPILPGSQFSIAGDVLQLINLNSLNTGMLTEGVNLYYTDARSRGAISAGSGISYNSSTGVISSTGGGVLSISGTANQVLANGTSGSAQTGAVALTLPQSIGTSSAVRFGSIAVGTVSSYPLHIVSGNGYMLCDLSSTYAAQYVGVTSGGAELRTYGDSSGNAHIGTITNHDLAFRTNDVNKMWLTNTGYLGIGVYPTAGVYLDVYSIMYVRDANAGLKIATSWGVNYIQSASAGMTGSADLRFTDMNVANTWMTIKATTGNIGVGVTAPATKFHIQTSGTTTNQMLTIENAVTSSAGQPTLLLKRSRGTISSQTTLVNGDTIGALTFQGYDGSNYISAASISAVSDNTVGTNSMPTALSFRVTPIGGVATVERMRISSYGQVDFNSPINSVQLCNPSTYALDVNGYARISSQLEVKGNYMSAGYSAGVSGGVFLNNSGVYGYPWIQAQNSASNPTSLLLNRQGGNVGIGCTPVAKLHVSAGAGAPTSYANYSLLMYDSGLPSTSYGIGIDFSTVWYNSEIYHQWFASGVQKMLLDGSGNLSAKGTVGVQNYAPTAASYTCGNGNVGDASSYANYRLLMYDVGSAASSYGLGIAGSTLWYNTHSYHEWKISNVQKMFMDSGGNLFVGGTTGSNGLFIRGSDNALGSYMKIYNTAKTGGNCPEWVMYNMGSAYGNGLQFWMYPASGGAYNPVTFADTGNVNMAYNLTMSAGGISVSRGKPVNFSADPTSLDDSIHMVNGYPYGLRISGANDGANHRNTQIGYYDAGTWRNTVDIDNYTGWVFIANRTSVPGTPSGGGVLYCESGALKYKGSSGTVTTIAPA